MGSDARGCARARECCGNALLRRSPDSRSYPQSCHLFESAYKAADARAQQYNDEHLQIEMAHPARAMDDWRAAEEAKLEQGALILQRNEKALPAAWNGFPFLLSDAVNKMTGQTTIDLGDGTTSTGPSCPRRPP